MAGTWKLAVGFVFVVAGILAGQGLVRHYRHEDQMRVDIQQGFIDCLEDEGCDYERAKTLRDEKLQTIPDTSFLFLLGAFICAGAALFSLWWYGQGRDEDGEGFP